jgi:hypothetical protein
MAGPIPYPESPYPPPQRPQQQFPQPGAPVFFPGQVPSSYPGTLPPAVQYPKEPRGRRLVLIGVVLAVIAVVAAVVAALVMRSDSRGDGTLTVDDASATTAIQGYLDALSKGDDDTIARNNSCGFFDAVKDRRPDMTIAKLSSDAFRSQYGAATVSSIDKIVTWSTNQAQVLFTMRATPAGRSQGQVERQATAQLLVQDNHILVCSYLPRNTGQF